MEIDVITYGLLLFVPRRSIPAQSVPASIAHYLHLLRRALKNIARRCCSTIRARLQISLFTLYTRIRCTASFISNHAEANSQPKYNKASLPQTGQRRRQLPQGPRLLSRTSNKVFGPKTPSAVSQNRAMSSMRWESHCKFKGRLTSWRDTLIHVL